MNRPNPSTPGGPPREADAAVPWWARARTATRAGGRADGPSRGAAVADPPTTPVRGRAPEDGGATERLHTGDEATREPAANGAPDEATREPAANGRPDEAAPTDDGPAAAGGPTGSDSGQPDGREVSGVAGTSPAAGAGPAPGGGTAPAPGVRTPAWVPSNGPLTRRRSGRMLGGVAGGVADHLGVDVRWVRAGFVVLMFLGMSGVFAYGLMWVFVREEDTGVERTVSRSERLQAAGLLALGVGLALVAATAGSSVVGWIAGPLGLATLGAAVVWREADESQRRRWARDARTRVIGSRAALLRTVLGAILVMTGLAVFLVGNLDLGQVRFGILAAIATLLGVAVLTVPWWVRLVRDLGEERRARLIEAERMEVAAHLHDSVLQTLALIQRQAGDSREVQRLARGQERELRSWLYGPGGRARGGDGQATASDATLSAAITRAAGEVEDTYAVAVGPVLVGDAELDGDLRALVLAAREAMVNAAKHSGTAEVDVYVEVEPASDEGPGVAEVFIRDRGRGFDPDAVRDDRHGLADSIHERMRRHGGTVRIRTGAGEGTEVRLSMPLAEKETA